MKLRLRYSKHLWVPILVIILLAQTLTIAILINRVRILWLENNPPGVEVNFQTKQYIHDAMTSLYSLNPVSIDAQAKRIYFTDLHTYLPYDDKTKQIDYVFSPADSGFPAQGSFNTRNAVNFLPNSFGQIPCLQRMYDYSVDMPLSAHSTGGERLTDQLKLADGRTVYFYLNQQAADTSACKQLWNNIGLSPSDMLSQLKKMQSY